MCKAICLARRASWRPKERQTAGFGREPTFSIRESMELSSFSDANCDNSALNSLSSWRFPHPISWPPHRIPCGPGGSFSRIGASIDAGRRKLDPALHWDCHSSELLPFWLRRNPFTGIGGLSSRNETLGMLTLERHWIVHGIGRIPGVSHRSMPVAARQTVA